MTSFRLSELPIPYRSAGASPLGTHEGTVTPPEPPTPPTPTGLTYFSGTSIGYMQEEADYAYDFTASAAEHADKFIEKEVGDELAVTINGTKQTIAISNKDEYEEDGVVYYDILVGMLTDEMPLVLVSMSLADGVYAYEAIVYRSLAEIPSVTLVIADPA